MVMMFVKKKLKGLGDYVRFRHVEINPRAGIYDWDDPLDSKRL